MSCVVMSWPVQSCSVSLIGSDESCAATGPATAANATAEAKSPCRIENVETVLAMSCFPCRFARSGRGVGARLGFPWVKLTVRLAALSITDWTGAPIARAGAGSTRRGET